MKVLFLDIDGVCNNQKTRERQGNTKFIGIKPELAELVRHIVKETDCKIVLSSSWRLFPDSAKWAEDHICKFIDKTVDMQKGEIFGVTDRGHEVQEWLDRHPAVESYAILDDDSHFLPHQWLFQTTWATGLTPEIAEAVISHLNARGRYDIKRI